MTLEDRLKAKARELNFDLVGITTPRRPETYAAFRDWLSAGHAGEMHYMKGQATAREDPEAILASVKSIVVVALNYKQPDRSKAAGLRGRIASYAQGQDYHEVMWRKLDDLLAFAQMQVPGCLGRGVVDTAPLLERDFARRAGLGWFGKNTMLIHPTLGSYFFIGALLLSIPLESDPPFATEHCGTCTACLEACPTQAFPEAGVLDSRKCISYLTIELKSQIPEPLRPAMGDWIFGCDACQDVCPWNHKAPDGVEPAFAAQAKPADPDLAELLALTPVQFRERFRYTALMRPKRRGLLRNVCIALGNLSDPAAVAPLKHALHDDEALIRGAAAWALGRLGTPSARAALSLRRELEKDAIVLVEIIAALEMTHA